MGGASSFLAMLSIACFLFCGWLATKISKAAGVSSILLEITTGVILGPAVLGVVAPAYAECHHRRHVDCTPPADFEQLILDGKSLGESLDDTAAGLHCPKSNYHYEENGEAHGTSANAEGTTANDDQHGWADMEEQAAAADAHGDAADAHGAADASVGSHAAANAHAAAPADTQANDTHAADTGHHRRLSGGSSYHYSECLLKSCEAEIAHDCQLTPDFLTLIGHTGVALMIFESGMHFDFEKARIVGPKACCVAVLGTILPFVTGALLTVIYGRPFMPDGVSVGTALAPTSVGIALRLLGEAKVLQEDFGQAIITPTSVGIALRLLGEAKVLQEDFGQAIITAAFVDDILSLVLFNVLFSLRGDFQVVPVVVFPILGIVFMIVAMIAAVKFWPKLINETIMPRIPARPGAKVSPQDEALFLIMMTVLLAYATLTYYLGTHLWGCFIAGMSFACIDKHQWPHHVWVKQTKRATTWMIRIFFSATVAFSIPVSSLLSIDAFLKGSVMGIGPCILTKVLCAPFMGDAKFVIGWAMVGRAEFAYFIAQSAAAADPVHPHEGVVAPFMGDAKFVIGWAMVGRAEFAYLIAQSAAAADMMDRETFSIVIWALLYATIFAPFIFRKVLDRYVKRHFNNENGPQDELKDADH
eukprot:CAMPEP_0183487620 /NCGR_PEP_ID=MMETSP0370-20130417/180527_1 /TAXON_ID=268820 /ORGANISM="Peridinium aciculiferum, Strain PAER-2" /LENGTH=644 /DNA_ID=CAMNT_0025680947 /DNA_START=11 /DNA_END=1946 /DNA_ORIENTATION=-